MVKGQLGKVLSIQSNRTPGPGTCLWDLLALWGKA